MDLEILYLGIVLVNIILFIYLGIYLIIKGKKSNFENLIVFGFSNILIVISFIIMFISTINRSIWPIYYIINLTFNLVILFFVEITFYKGRKSPFKFLFIISIILGLVLITVSLLMDHFLILEENYLNQTIYNCLDIMQYVLVFGWYGRSAQKSYEDLKNKSIEPWIIKKIKIIAFSAYYFVFFQIPELFVVDTHHGDFNNVIGMLIFYSQVLILSTYAILQFLAWTMPKWFKKYLNRNHEEIPSIVTSSTSENDISEEELYKMLTDGSKNA